MKRKIIYFDEPGPQNTDAVIESVSNKNRKWIMKHGVFGKYFEKLRM